MQLTTILAVLFSCLVLFAASGYADRNFAQGRSPLSHRNYLSKPRGSHVAQHGGPFRYGGRQFVGRAILESVKQRRRH